MNLEEKLKVRSHSALFLIILLFSAAEAISQTDSGRSSPAWLRLSFEQRTRYEQLSNPFRANASETERYFPMRTRLMLEIGESSRPVRMVVEFQDARVLNDENRINYPRSHINEHDVLQAHLQFSTKDMFSSGAKSRIQAGRFTMDLGKRRLVARNSMRNTTNAFDGISWTLTGNQEWALQSFLTRPVSIDPYDWDMTSRRYFWGVYLTYSQDPRLLTDLYYLGIRDMGSSGSEQKLGTVGGRIYRMPKTGSPDYEIETAWQSGRNGLLDHNAYFFHGEAGLTFDSAWKPRISLHYDYASGDNDPEDTKSGQFNTLCGARAFELGATGIYGPVYRSNIATPGIKIALSPAESFRIMSMYRAFRLAQARDAWVGSGLRDPAGNSGKSIGANLDTRLQWQMKDYFMVELGYSHFFKGSYLRRASEIPDTKDSDYLYIATEFKTKVLPF